MTPVNSHSANSENSVSEEDQECTHEQSGDAETYRAKLRTRTGQPCRARYQERDESRDRQRQTVKANHDHREPRHLGEALGRREEKGRHQRRHRSDRSTAESFIVSVRIALATVSTRSIQSAPHTEPATRATSVFISFRPRRRRKTDTRVPAAQRRNTRRSTHAPSRRSRCSSTDHGPPPPAQPPATKPRPARRHSRSRSASLSSHAWRMASCWAGVSEQPWRAPATRIPARIAERALSALVTRSPDPPAAGATAGA